MYVTKFFEALKEVSGAEFDVNGNEVCIEFDGRKLIFFVNPQDLIITIYAELAQLGKYKTGEICKKLLMAHFLLIETCGASLSYFEPSNLIGLNTTISVKEIEPEEFLKKVESFLVQAEYWQKRVEDLNKEYQEQLLNEQKNILSKSNEFIPINTDNFIKV